MKHLIAGLIAGTFVASVATAEAGREFRVNAYTTGDQWRASVAADGVGRFMVVWTSYGQSGRAFGLFGQQVDSTGALVGGEVQLNTDAGANQERQDLDGGTDGYLVAWEQTDGHGEGIWGRKYDSSGLFSGAAFRVNAYTTGQQENLRLSRNSDGAYVVVWEQRELRSISGIHLNADGAALSAEFEVGAGQQPRVSSSGGGGFAVVWETQARLYDGSASPRGSGFDIRSDTSVRVDSSDSAFTLDGNLLVAFATDPDCPCHVMARAFAPDGTPLGDQYIISQDTSQLKSHVAMTRDASTGAIVVVWTESDSTGTSRISGRMLNATALPVAGQFQVNGDPRGLQDFPRIAASSETFVVAWDSGEAGSEDVWARVLRVGKLLRNDDVRTLAPIEPPLADILPLTSPDDDYRSTLIAGEVDPDLGVVEDRTRPLVFYSTDGDDRLQLVKVAGSSIRVWF